MTRLHSSQRIEWDTIIALNLTAAFHTIRLALPGMKRKKWGRIIQIGSAHALVASLASYLASDAAEPITGALMSIDGGWTAH